MKINELNDGIRIIENFLITNVTKGASNTGQVYLTISLQDNTGQIEAKVWDATEDDLSFYRPGTFVRLVADVIDYRGTLQLKIITSELIEPSAAKIEEYTIASPVDFASMKKRFEKLMKTIKDKDVAAIVGAIVDNHYDDFLVYPAASKLHHEYTHGLLEHTLALTGIADAIINFYQDLYEGKWEIDRDLVIGGLIIHDIGKTIELSGPVLTNYTLEGKLIGHISLMNAEVIATAKELKITNEVPTLLSHIVLSHHGKLEFGSPVVPLTKEAILISMIDDLDAKLKIIDKALATTSAGEFTDRLWSMNHTSFYKSKKR